MVSNLNSAPFDHQFELTEHRTNEFAFISLRFTFSTLIDQISGYLRVSPFHFAGLPSALIGTDSLP